MTLNEKANDLKTSGCALTICGGAGVIFMILVLSGVMPLSLAGPFGILTKCIMSILFVLFLVTGLISLKRSKSAFEDAKRETDKKNEIKKWFIDTYTAESLDEIIDNRPEEGVSEEGVFEEGDISAAEADSEAYADNEGVADDDEASYEEDASVDEEKADDGYDDEAAEAEFDNNYRFFARSELIKDKICERFMDVEDALMSELIEEIYNEIFEDGDIPLSEEDGEEG